MKEMIYQKDEKRELLDSGICFGYKYYILNLGTHPTAYINIPKRHPFYNKDNYEIYDICYDIEVHGGLTYSKGYLWISDNEKIKGWFIGWDYGHYGDYAGYEEMLPKNIRVGGKKWTTEEIREEVYNVCKQLKEQEEK